MMPHLRISVQYSIFVMRIIIIREAVFILSSTEKLFCLSRVSMKVRRNHLLLMSCSNWSMAVSRSLRAVRAIPLNLTNKIKLVKGKGKKVHNEKGR